MAMLVSYHVNDMWSITLPVNTSEFRNRNRSGKEWECTCVAQTKHKGTKHVRDDSRVSLMGFRRSGELVNARKSIRVTGGNIDWIYPGRNEQTSYTID